VHIIRARDCKITPWKNGGGSTTEIAIGPAGASLDTFDWRVSLARVATDGPFSDFTGIDRTLAVVKGSGLVLIIGESAPMTLSSGAEPVSFRGDTQTSACLTAGEITDLNVMTRQGRFRHRLLRIDTTTSCGFGDDDIAIVLSPEGAATVSHDQDSIALDPGDAVLVERTAVAGFQISPATGQCYLVWLREQRTSSLA
jgi:hypothetical protein